jgi:hypothetical protein
MSGGMEEMYAEEPRHYKDLTPEPISVIEGWGLGFNLGNAVKYISRCNRKGDREGDLRKAIYYIDRELHRASVK